MDYLSANSDSDSDNCCDECATGLLQCSLCPKRLLEFHIFECYEKCHNCDSIICCYHYFTGLFSAFDGCRRHHLCVKCYEDSDNIMKYQLIFKGVAASHYGKIIREKDSCIKKLQEKVQLLETMVEYMPDGLGYERAKSNFSTLASCLQKK